MGPIDRAVNFIPELKKKIYVDIDRVVSGFRLVVWGVFKKMVISDRLAIFVNEVFRDPEQQGYQLNLWRLFLCLPDLLRFFRLLRYCHWNFKNPGL